MLNARKREGKAMAEVRNNENLILQLNKTLLTGKANVTI